MECIRALTYTQHTTGCVLMSLGAPAYCYKTPLGSSACLDCIMLKGSPMVTLVPTPQDGGGISWQRIGRNMSRPSAVLFVSTSNGIPPRTLLLGMFLSEKTISMRGWLLGESSQETIARRKLAREVCSEEKAIGSVTRSQEHCQSLYFMATSFAFFSRLQ